MGEAFLTRFYTKKERLSLWVGQYQEKPLSIDFWYNNGQRKEDCMSLVLHYQGRDLFQIMFWLTKNTVGESQLYIGVLQGPKDGSEIIKNLIKAFYGYRSKDLLFMGYV